MGCGCLSAGLHACTTAPITERKQLKLISETKLNAYAARPLLFLVISNIPV